MVFSPFPAVFNVTSTRFADRVGQGHGTPNYMKKDTFYSVFFNGIIEL